MNNRNFPFDQRAVRETFLPLHYAIDSCRRHRRSDADTLRMVDVLLAAKADARAHDFAGTTAMHAAGSPAVVARLLEAKASLNAVDRFGLSPVCRALLNCDLDAAATLLNCRADATPMEESTSPLTSLCRRMLVDHFSKELHLELRPYLSRDPASIVVGFIVACWEDANLNRVLISTSCEFFGAM